MAESFARVSGVIGTGSVSRPPPAAGRGRGSCSPVRRSPPARLTAGRARGRTWHRQPWRPRRRVVPPGWSAGCRTIMRRCPKAGMRSRDAGERRWPRSAASPCSRRRAAAPPPSPARPAASPAAAGLPTSSSSPPTTSAGATWGRTATRTSAPPHLDRMAAEGAAVDELLQPGPGVLAEPGGPADGPHPPAERDVRPPAGRLLPRLARGAAGRGGHAGRGAAGRRLRHRHRGQVAPGPPARVTCRPGTGSTRGSASPTRTTWTGGCRRARRAGPRCSIRGRTTGTFPSLRDETVVERPADQHTVTRRYAEEAVSFIEAHRDRPFFLYLPHTMPHMPLFRSERLPGPQHRRRSTATSSRRFDWAVGQVIRDARAPRAGRADPGGVHERQRPLAQLPEPRRLGRPAAERQGNDLRGRHCGCPACSGGRGRYRARRGPGHRFGHGPVHHRRRPRRRRGAGRPAHRRGRPDSGAAGHGASAAGDHGLLPDGRAVRLPAGPLQGAFHDPEPLRRAQGVDATDGPQPDRGHPADRPDRARPRPCCTTSARIRANATTSRPSAPTR